MVSTMIDNRQVVTKPQSIQEACGQIELLAQNIVKLAKNVGIGNSYGGWVGDIMSDSRHASILDPSNSRTIGFVWPYRNRRRHSYSDDQICLAVQVAIILEIGDRLDANASAAAAEYADISLRHSVTEAQIETRRIIEQLVAANLDGVDQNASLYRLRWFRKWELITAMHDNFDEN